MPVTGMTDAEKQFLEAELAVAPNKYSIDDLRLSFYRSAIAGTFYLKDAPSDGTQYARKDGAWEAVAGGGGAATPSILTLPRLSPTSTNLIADPNFRIRIQEDFGTTDTHRAIFYNDGSNAADMTFIPMSNSSSNTALGVTENPGGFEVFDLAINTATASYEVWRIIRDDNTTGQVEIYDFVVHNVSGDNIGYAAWKVADSSA